MMSEHDLGTSAGQMIFDSQSATNSLTVVRNPVWMFRHEPKQPLRDKGLSQSSFSLE
jgi:hypothetical protein